MSWSDQRVFSDEQSYCFRILCMFLSNSQISKNGEARLVRVSDLHARSGLASVRQQPGFCCATGKSRAWLGSQHMTPHLVIHSSMANKQQWVSVVVIDWGSYVRQLPYQTCCKRRCIQDVHPCDSDRLGAVRWSQLLKAEWDTLPPFVFRFVNQNPIRVLNTAWLRQAAIAQRCLMLGDYALGKAKPGYNLRSYKSLYQIIRSFNLHTMVLFAHNYPSSTLCSLTALLTAQQSWVQLYAADMKRVKAFSQPADYSLNLLFRIEVINWCHLGNININRCDLHCSSN